MVTKKTPLGTNFQYNGNGRVVLMSSGQFPMELSVEDILFIAGELSREKYKEAVRAYDHPSNHVPI